MTPNGSNISDVERVRDAADIVRIVGEHVSLRAKGREYVGLCPFHDDRNPSMSVVPAKQIFHCFVCGTGGDVFSFIQKYHRMDFREALEHLAERCNVQLRPAPRAAAGPAPGAAEGFRRSTLAEANAQAAAFYRAVLAHEEHGRAGREVVERRGISPEMVERFSLGAAPDRWDGLCRKVEALRADPALYRAAGLLKPRDDGSFYDAFRNRLIFPIRDQIGRVIAFGARRIDDQDEPKYLNSSETPLFNKSAAIFGLYQAARAIQKEGLAVVTEGYTDVIACHQAGFENVVATLGTALTPAHAGLLRRLCDTVVLLFDGDEAGQNAADRAAEVFFAEPIDVRIATLSAVTDAKDPDELLKRPDGPDLFTRAIRQSVDLLDFRFARMRERLAGAGLSALQRATEEEIRTLARLGFHRVSPIRRKLVLRRLAALTGLDEGLIARQLRAGRERASARGSEDRTPPAAPESATPGGPVHLVEALGCLLTDAALWASLDASDRALFDPEAFSGPTRQVVDAALALAGPGGAPDLRALLDRLEDADAKARAVEIQTRAEHRCEQRLAAYLRDCLRQAHRQRAEREAEHSPHDDRAFASLIELKRRQIERFGPDRTRIARPTGGSP
jgi:DNA primase